MTDQQFHDLVSIGYRDWEPKPWMAALLSADVAVVVDVRYSATAPVFGLSQAALRVALKKRGVRYLHAQSLGNPADNRAGVRHDDPDSVKRYLTILHGAKQRSALERIDSLLREGNVALLCACTHHRWCHRRFVAEALGFRANDSLRNLRFVSPQPLTAEHIGNPTAPYHEFDHPDVDWCDTCRVDHRSELPCLLTPA